MKTLACNDLGTPECEFKAESELAAEVIEKMYAHASEVHKDKLDKMRNENHMSDDQIKEMMAIKVKEENNDD